MTALRQPSIALRSVTTTELLSEPDEPVPFLVPGLVPKQGLIVLAAAPKVGKTLLASQLSLATGANPSSLRPGFLGRDVVHGAALYVMEEGSRESLRYRVRRQMLGMKIRDSSVTWLHQQRVRLDHPPSIAELLAEVRDIEPSLVILDPLNRIHGLDENRPSEMTRVMAAAASIVSSTGGAVIIVHHLTKPSGEHRGRLVDRIRGAGSIMAATDANIVMESRGANRVRLEGEFRDADPTALDLDFDADSLLFSQSEPKATMAKVPLTELLEFIDRRRRVTARDVMEHFNVVRVTALTALENAPGLECEIGTRGQRQYFRSTVQ